MHFCVIPATPVAAVGQTPDMDDANPEADAQADNQSSDQSDDHAGPDTPTPVALTHEHEITEPVQLCLPGGTQLNPAARGWSRVPLHDCNLSGTPGRKKRWDYWAVLTPTHALSVTYADVDYLGITDVWWVDLRTGRTGGRNRSIPGGVGVSLPDRPGTEPLRSAAKHQVLDLTDEPGGTRLSAAWTEADGTAASLDVFVELANGHESLNVVIPWNDELFQFTSKHQARPAHGTLTIGDEITPIGTDEHGDAAPAWGVLDVGRGRWPYETRWNWGGGAGVANTGAVIGIQIGAKWTEGTGFTENGIIVDGRLSKLGSELTWTYDWDHPMDPWHVVDPSGRMDLALTPTYDKHTVVDAKVMGTEVHQVFGTWAGTVVDDDGRTFTLDGALGFAEESRSRW